MSRNITQLTPQTGVADPTSLLYSVVGGTSDRSLPLSVFVNSLGLTGVPTTPTAIVGTNSTQIASTAFVQTQLTTSLVPYALLSGATFTGAVTVGYSNPSLIISDLSGTNPASLYFQNNGLNEWRLYKDTSQNFSIGRYVSGSLTDTPINIATSTGLVTLAKGVAITGGTINSASVGATTPSTGAFTTLSASITVSGAGFSTYLASPPAIGGTAAAAGSFTTLSATGLITPSTTNGIKGTTLADNANTGSVGELLTNSTSGTSLTTATPANATSVTLTAGDWDVQGGVSFIPAGSTTVSALICSINTTSATTGGLTNGIQNLALTFTTGATQFMQTGVVRVNVSTSTTVFLVAQANFGVSTMTCNGLIRARRVR